VKYLVEFKQNKISLDFLFCFASRQNEKRKTYFIIPYFFHCQKSIKKSRTSYFYLSHLFLRESLGTLPIIIGIKQPSLLSLRSLLAFMIKLEMFMIMNLFSLFDIRYSLFERRETIYKISI
jgi:hypothetical protein